MHQLPGNVKTLLHPNQADEFKVGLRQSLADGTWGKPETVDPESVIMSPPLLPANSPLNKSVFSPAPTVQSSLSSYNSASMEVLPDSVQALLDPADSNSSDQHTISYYSRSSAAPSPASTNISLHAPPSSPAYSRLQNYSDAKSPYSTVSSPASSAVGVVSTTSSFVSVTSVQRSLKRKAMLSFDSDVDTFSPRAPDAAIASTFGNCSTNFLPNFSQVPFQNSQVPVRSQSQSLQFGDRKSVV